MARKSIAPKTRKEAKFPDTADAEKWLDPDRFLYKGQVYRITSNFKVVKEE